MIGVFQPVYEITGSKKHIDTIKVTKITYAHPHYLKINDVCICFWHFDNVDIFVADCTIQYNIFSAVVRINKD